MGQDHRMARAGLNTNVEAPPPEQLTHECGALLDPLVARRDTGHRAELGQLGNPALHVISDVAVDPRKPVAQTWRSQAADRVAAALSACARPASAAAGRRAGSSGLGPIALRAG